MAQDGERDEAVGRRIDALGKELRLLRQRVSRIEEMLASEAPSTEVPVSGSAPAPGEAAAQGPSVTWGATTTLLSRAAFVCLLLVVALVLRTVTDNGLIGPRVGSLSGIGYAGLLMAAAWILYGRTNPLAPILSVSGTLLLCTVVLETHARLGVVSAPTGYGLLILAGAAMSWVSHRHRVALPACVGTPAIVVSALLLGLSGPYLPYLVVLMLVAGGMAYAVVGRRGCGWLRAFVLLATLLAWAAWAQTIHLAILQGGATWSLGLPGYVLLLLVFAAFYLGGAYRRAAGQGGSSRLGVFDALLPSVTAAWTYPAALAAFDPGRGGIFSLGLAGTVVSALLFGLGANLARKDKPGANAFAFAGSLLLAIALPGLLGSTLLALPFLSAAAFALCVAARRWRSGMVRVTSYLLQAYVPLAAVLSGSVSVAAEAPELRMLAAAAFAAIAFGHYRWARSHPPDAGLQPFSDLDPRDVSAVVLFLASLVGGFLALRGGAYEILIGAGIEAADAFGCAQSIIVNLGALGLILAAFRVRSGEVRAVAILVIVLGALKVFLFDLFAARGVPLVLGVASFGVAAALGSVVLRRWQPSEKG